MPAFSPTARPTASASDLTTPVIVSIAIPPGVWTGATWMLTGTAGGAGTDTLTDYLSGFAVSFTARGAGGAINESVAATTNQMKDINGASGGALTVNISSTSTLTGATLSIVLTGTPSPAPTSGAPGVSQVLEHTDGMATVFKNNAPAFGLGSVTETATLAAYISDFSQGVLGNASTTFGLGNPDWTQRIQPYALAINQAARYDTYFASMFRDFIFELDNQVRKNLPDTWKFLQGGIAHLTDAYLLRQNGMLNAPTTPGAAGTLTATNDPLGGLPATSTGNAPRILHTLVGVYDYRESLPSAEANQTAIAQTAATASQNAYTYAITGAVPANVYKVRMYRTLFGGAAGGPYCWIKDIIVTPGAGSFPVILLTESDLQLRQDWRPPQWGSVLQSPEFAVVFALAFGTLSKKPGQSVLPMQLVASGMLSPQNVALNPATAYLGLNNPVSSALFGTRTIGTGYTAGNFQSVNNAPNNVQGFAGSWQALQARVTTALNANATLTPTYTYYDAAHGWGVAQTATATAAVLPLALGSTIQFVIPAGRVVVGVTSDTVAGAATGAYVYEALSLRNY